MDLQNTEHQTIQKALQLSLELEDMLMRTKSLNRLPNRLAQEFLDATNGYLALVTVLGKSYHRRQQK
eukprot:4331369-Karenia_brevis.AAC.1